MKKLLLTSVIAVLTVVSVASADPDPEPTPGDKRITSKNYVDTQVGTKQNTIPATGTNLSNSGNTVVMYTGSAGTVGERQIYSNGAAYTAGTDADKLVAASALNYSVTHIPEITTSKLTCVDSPDCTLWSVDDQTVYGQQNNNQ